MCRFRFILQSKKEINELLVDKQKNVDDKIKELEVRDPEHTTTQNLLLDPDSRVHSFIEKAKTTMRSSPH